MRGCVRFMLIALAIAAASAAAQAGERKSSNALVSVNRAKDAGLREKNDERSSAVTGLDRIAYAVDGAESSHGSDPAMWGFDASGPQGPMQVTEAAAADVGGGDRFDLIQNRAIGRDYLALLFRRYQNWPDAIAAYNWGMGNVDAWIRAGRPADKFLVGVAAYLRRVLHDSGMCNRPAPMAVRQPVTLAEGGGLDAVFFASTACADLDAWGGFPGGMHSNVPALNRFRGKLDKASRLAAQHLPSVRGP
jgi:hypothetical protein